jgi:transposase InsO family protein
MDERLQFVADHTRQLWSMTELCDRYGVSRKTGYKWIDRYVRHGAAGLEVRTSRPRHSPQTTDPAIAKAIIDLRRREKWGGKKIVAVLTERHPTWVMPAVSTANDILKRAGLVATARRNRPLPPAVYHPAALSSPNQVWTADFKGQFRTRNGQLCYPLTICDRWSRFLLTCHALPVPSTTATKEIFRRAFREYGLPERIRTDNGEPFAAASLGRLSRLSVEWIRLGIYPELIAPGSPQQNGAHERMHRTLKADTTRPPAGTLRGQHLRFAAFRRRYNRVRPHEALGQRPPARLYTPSPRRWPTIVEPLVYPGHYEIRRVSAPGVMWWHSRRVNISTVLIGESIGLEPIDDGEWDLHFGPIRLGRFDERTRRIQPAARRQR